MRTAWKVTAAVGVGVAWWLALTQDADRLSLVGAAAMSLVAVAFAGPLFAEANPFAGARGLLRLDLFALHLLTILIRSYVASAEIAWRMLTRRYRPGVVRVRTRLGSPMGRVLLANTISLIPGTLSLWIRDQHLYVHQFDSGTTHSIKAAHLILRGPESQLKRIFG